MHTNNDVFIKEYTQAHSTGMEKGILCRLACIERRAKAEANKALREMYVCQKGIMKNFPHLTVPINLKVGISS